MNSNKILLFLVLIFSIQTVQAQWTETTPLPLTGMTIGRDITRASDGTLYVGGDGIRVYSANSNGTSWTDTSVLGTVAFNALAAGDSGNIYALTGTAAGSGIHRYNGTTWTTLKTFDNISSANDIVYVGNNTLYFSYFNDVNRSTDGGVNWASTGLVTALGGSASSYSVQDLDYDETGAIYAVVQRFAPTQAEVWRYNGTTWTQVAALLNYSSSRILAHKEGSAPTQVFINNNTILLKGSGDGALTFSEIKTFTNSVQKIYRLSDGKITVLEGVKVWRSANADSDIIAGATFNDLGNVRSTGTAGGITQSANGNLYVLAYWLGAGGSSNFESGVYYFGSAPPPSQVCGNGTIESPEVCDGANLNSQTCSSQGFASGTLACNANCLGFNTSSCVSNPVCGNSVCDAGETSVNCSMDCGPASTTPKACCTNQDCSTSQICNPSNQRCETKTGTSCTSRANCPAGQSCVSGICGNSTSTDPNRTGQGTNCNGNNGICPIGYYCSPVTDTCVPGAVCSTSSTDMNNHTCPQTCATVTEQGYSTTSTTCLSQSCIPTFSTQNIPNGPVQCCGINCQTGQICGSNGTCQNRQRCSLPADFIGGTGSTTGPSCATDTTCATGYSCQTGFCRLAPDCPTGNTCGQDRYCAPSSAPVCPGSQECESPCQRYDTGLGQCVQDNSLPTCSPGEIQCCSDSQCGSTQVCVPDGSSTGICQERTTLTACESQSSYQEITCTTNADCAGHGINPICNTANNKCYNKTGTTCSPGDTTRGCSPNTECLENYCSTPSLEMVPTQGSCAPGTTCATSGPNQNLCVPSGTICPSSGNTCPIPETPINNVCFTCQGENCTITDSIECPTTGQTQAGSICNTDTDCSYYESCNIQTNVCQTLACTGTEVPVNHRCIPGSDFCQDATLRELERIIETNTTNSEVTSLLERLQTEIAAGNIGQAQNTLQKIIEKLPGTQGTDTITLLREARTQLEAGNAGQAQAILQRAAQQSGVVSSEQFSNQQQIQNVLYGIIGVLTAVIGALAFLYYKK